MVRICIIPNVSGVGGMVTFRSNLISALEAKGVQVCTDLKDKPYDVILVIAGTRQIGGLLRAKRQGIHIVQRLNGMNWIHRLHWTGLKHFFRAEYGNWLLAMIRSNLSDSIVYQSEFARRWWNRIYGSVQIPETVVLNGVNLEKFSPIGPHHRPSDHYRLLIVEGNLMGGYETGLTTAIKLAEGLDDISSSVIDRSIELMIVGRVEDEIKAFWQNRTSIFLDWKGHVPHSLIPEIDRSAHLLYSADINSACPNSIVEALACGLPVVSYDTGALPELVAGDAGIIVSYGGNPWRLENPDLSVLINAAVRILNDQQRYHAGARLQAEMFLGVETMVDKYLQVLLP